MIHSFSAANFYSIGKNIEVDFTVNENATDRSSYAVSFNDERVSLIEALVGPNASGKTNVLKALPFMRWLIVEAYTDDPDRTIPVRPFGHKGKDKPTLMSVAFSVEDRMFSYEFKLTRERILFEKLAERSKTSERLTSKTLFSRLWDSNLSEYRVKDRAFGIVDEVRIRKNSSVVATAFRDGNELATLIAQYWRDGVVATNVYERGYRSLHHHTLDHIADHTLDYFHKKPELKEKLEEMLIRYDIGFGAFKQHQVQERTAYSIEHIFGEVNIEVPLEYESSGTKQLIVVLLDILIALSVKGGIAIMDELDSNLHPEIVEDLIDMFASKELNPNNSQIIFSSHTPSVLSTLGKYQIVLVEKNDHGESEAWRLDHIKGVRADDNYYSKYIAGAYGAIPNIG